VLAEVLGATFEHITTGCVGLDFFPCPATRTVRLSSNRISRVAWSRKRRRKSWSGRLQALSVL